MSSDQRTSDLCHMFPSLTHHFWVISSLHTWPERWCFFFFSFTTCNWKEFGWQQRISRPCYVKIFALSLKPESSERSGSRWPSQKENSLEPWEQRCQNFRSVRWPAAVVGSFGVCGGVVITKVPGKCMEMNSKSAEQVHNGRLMRRVSLTQTW